MDEKEKLIVKELRKDSSLKDTEIAAILKQKQIFKDTKFDSLRRRICVVRNEHKFPKSQSDKWEKIYKEYEKKKKKYPERSIPVIAFELAKQFNLNGFNVRSRLYSYRRYGIC